MLVQIVENICIASVRFRFEHEPVWMQANSRFIVRDRTESCLSGAGIVTDLLEDSTSQVD